MVAPGGNAWLCNTLFEHYEYTQDRAYLEKIYPLLKGAVRVLGGAAASPRPSPTRHGAHARC